MPLVWLVCGTSICSIRMLLLLRSTVGVVGGQDSSCRLRLLLLLRTAVGVSGGRDLNL